MSASTTPATSANLSTLVGGFKSTDQRMPYREAVARMDAMVAKAQRDGWILAETANGTHLDRGVTVHASRTLTRSGARRTVRVTA